jgi:hypothetical protein
MRQNRQNRARHPSLVRPGICKLTASQSHDPHIGNSTGPEARIDGIDGLNAFDVNAGPVASCG